MKKYYFLNRNKQWRGPYWFPQILLFTLNGTIKPTTYLWHNKLANDIGKHPIESIYTRKSASDFRNLPFWMFGYNLRIMTLNTKNRWKKRLNRKNDWTSFASRPIEETSVLKNAFNVYLMPSITAINDFVSPGDFKVKLVYIESGEVEKVTVSEYPIQLFMDHNPGIKFEISMDQPPKVSGVLHKESYGLHRELTLTSENENISIAKNSVYDFSTRFPYQPQSLRGRFRQANLIGANNYKNRFNRLILHVDDDKIISPRDIITDAGRHVYDHEKFNVQSSLMGVSFRMGGSYTQIVIDKKHYRFYSIEGNVIIVDGLEREDLEIFKQKAEVMRIALAVITGKFYGGVCNYLTASEADFKTIDGIWYELENDSVLSKRRVIDLHFFRSVYRKKDEDGEDKYNAINGPVKSDLFSALCVALCTNESLLRAAKLVISGMGNSDTLQQGALYSVALETLTNTLGGAKSKDLKPIPENSLSRDFIAELMNVLHSYDRKISEEGMTILKKNIEGINHPTNRDKLMKTFLLYGIDLNELDKATIDKRNDYLHGRNPLNSKQEFELAQISLRLHTLVVALLLKSVGYSGHIVNLDIHVYLTDEEKIFQLAKEQQVFMTELINNLTDAAEKRDNAAFGAAKTEFIKHTKNNKLSDLIRII